MKKPDFRHLINRLEEVFKGKYLSFHGNDLKFDTFLVLKKLVEENSEHSYIRSLYIEACEMIGNSEILYTW